MDWQNPHGFSCQEPVGACIDRRCEVSERFRDRWGLVGIVDSGELSDFAGECLGPEAFVSRSTQVSLGSTRGLHKIRQGRSNGLRVAR